MTFVERERCPACGRASFDTVWRAPFNQGYLGAYLRDYYLREPPDADYWLCRCDECGLFYQKLVGDEMFMEQLYSKWITAIDDPWKEPSYAADMSDFRGSRDAHELITAAAYLGKPLAGMKVLDYGTGWGLWPTIAAKLGANAYAVELAPEKAEYVARQGVIVISEGEMAEHQFDFVNLEQVLEHLVEPVAVLRQVSTARIVKVAVPDASGTTGENVSRLRGIIPVQPLEHVNGFTPHALNMLAARVHRRGVRPSLMQRYSFLRRGFPRGPKRIIKELIRPIYRPPIYAWFESA
jgi:hypothetical protein